MKILVLGGDGMLGHQLVESWRSHFTIEVTVRRHVAAYGDTAPYLPEVVHYGVDVLSPNAVEGVLVASRPDVVVNAIGVVKQRDDSKNAIVSIETNALLPHRLADACDAAGARLIHLSTDCVFSGRKGMYTENDTPDPVDLYGRSKLLGEVSSPGAITLRTSIIGLELNTHKSLISWFLRQQGQIRGYRRAIYSGLTTMEMARVIENLLLNYPEASGLYQVSSVPIDKYTLLTKLRDRLDRALDIVPDDAFVCDRSLDSSEFRRVFSYQPPSWDAMLDELADQIKERGL